MCQQKDSFQLAHYHIGLLAHYHINTLFIMATKQEKMEAFGQLLDILDELRVRGTVNKQTKAFAQIQSKRLTNCAMPS